MNLIQTTNWMTKYEAWNDGVYNNMGSFEGYIFKAYAVGDSENRKILQDAYPEFFIINQQFPGR